MVTPPVPVPRAGVKLVAVGTLAAVAVAGVVVQTSGGNDKDGRPRSALPGPPVVSVTVAANVLDRASDAAEHRHFTPLRAHEWIYTEVSVTTGTGPGGAITGGPYTTLVDVLASTVRPPKEEAAIYQAIKRIPRVTLIKGKVDTAGRPAIALGLGLRPR